MKKHILLKTNVAICVIIILGFLTVSWINYQTYKTVLEDDIENISKLASSNIYAEINGELTKPIFVAQTMANDYFLKEWITKEATETTDLLAFQKLKGYLGAYKDKYGYDAVYTISAASNVYYYFDGVNKIIRPDNQHDQWYYDFVKSGKKYRLEIDSDEVNHNELTVFINCRIEAADGKLLGVTGVGVKMSRLQELLLAHERDYDLEAILINRDGYVQAATARETIGSRNLFAQKELAVFKERILNNLESREMYWYSDEKLDKYLITQYVENMDWYLVINKDTRAIRSSFEQLMKQDLSIGGLILLLLLSGSTFLVGRYNKLMTKALNTDALTQLYNQNKFNEEFVVQHPQDGSILFLMDIDNFKKVNDTQGHLFGNTILVAVAKIVNEKVSTQGLAARWGGDEFIGLLNLDAQVAQQIFAEIMRQVKTDCKCGENTITLSIGAIVVGAEDSLDYLMERADKAMYLAKSQGGNRVHFFSK
ncbi:MAG: diguanylate cyclase [Acidaminococcaceae bacterium]